MAVIAVLITPTAAVRVWMIRNGSPSLMAYAALFSSGRSQMTTVAVLIAPSRPMGIGMRTQVGFMAYRTTRPCAFAHMTVETMILLPSGIMRQGPRIGMTRIAGILLMTH
jgi:hypothetical protein